MKQNQKLKRAADPRWVAENFLLRHSSRDSVGRLGYCFASLMRQVCQITALAGSSLIGTLQ